MNKTRLTTRTGLNNYKTCIIAFTILLGLSSMTMAALAPIKTAATKEKVATYDARVVGITDGDTISILTNNNQSVKVRLYGIDAPERNQAYGSKAKEFLSSLIYNRTVTVQPISLDQYGRLIARIYLDGREMSLTMVQYGFAMWYQQYAKKDIELKNAQAKAKKQQLGIWQEANPTPPWEFRKKVVK